MSEDELDRQAIAVVSRGPGARMFNQQYPWDCTVGVSRAGLLLGCDHIVFVDYTKEIWEDVLCGSGRKLWWGGNLKSQPTCLVHDRTYWSFVLKRTILATLHIAGSMASAGDDLWVYGMDMVGNDDWDQAIDGEWKGRTWSRAEKRWRREAEYVQWMMGHISKRVGVTIRRVLSPDVDYPDYALSEFDWTPS